MDYFILRSDFDLFGVAMRRSNPPPTEKLLSPTNSGGGGGVGFRSKLRACRVILSDFELFLTISGPYFWS